MSGYSGSLPVLPNVVAKRIRRRIKLKFGHTTVFRPASVQEIIMMYQDDPNQYSDLAPEKPYVVCDYNGNIIQFGPIGVLARQYGAIEDWEVISNDNFDFYCKAFEQMQALKEHNWATDTTKPKRYRSYPFRLNSIYS